MEHTAFVYQPPLWKRMWYRLRRLRMRGTHTEATPLPEGYKDGIVLTNRTHFGFADRIRILFGGIPEIRIHIATKEKTGGDKPFQSSVIIS